MRTNRARGVALALWLAAGSAQLAPCAAPGEAPPEGSNSQTSGLPAHLAEGWYAKIETSLGTIIARLLPDQAPQSVAHFAALAEGRLPWTDRVTGEGREGPYYDGQQVYQAVAGQRFDAGDPTGTGRGSPLIFVPFERKGPVSFNAPGRLGMATNTLGWVSGTRFFVTSAAISWLSAQSPCFGEVVAGKDVAWSICAVKTDPNGHPIEPVVIQRIRIHKVGSPPPLPDPISYKPPRLRKLQLKPEGK